MTFSKNISNTLFLAFILLFIAITNVNAQTVPDRPSPPRLVNDFTNTLSKKEVRVLEKKLVRFNDTTSNQITVVIVNTLGGITPSMFAYEIGENWKVGQKKFDNGIVVLVKPKLPPENKGEVYIAVGYGLEPAIPDAIARRIVENEMIPSFRNNDYYTGINKATTILMEMASGEITAEGYRKQSGANGLVTLLPFIVIIIILMVMRSSRSRTQGISSGGSGSLWTALWLGSMMGSGRSSGSWGNFSGGGSGFGGGGSFGGFGGGSFGGGGAGGSW